jgi:hypothetical protein
MARLQSHEVKVGQKYYSLGCDTWCNTVPVLCSLFSVNDDNTFTIKSGGIKIRYSAKMWAEEEIFTTKSECVQYIKQNPDA